MTYEVPEGFAAPTASSGGARPQSSYSFIDESGASAVFPTISIFAIQDYQGETSEGYVRRWLEHSDVVLGPRRAGLGSIDATEFAVVRPIHVRDADIPFDDSRAVKHSFVFDVRGQAYACELESWPHEYEEFIPAVTRFCASVRADSLRQAAE